MRNVDHDNKLQKSMLLFTGKSLTMLCHFQDFQVKSSPVLSEADVRKRFNLARTGAIKAISAVRYPRCDNGDV